MTSIEKAILEVVTDDFMTIGELTQNVAKKLGYSMSSSALTRGNVALYVSILTGQGELEVETCTINEGEDYDYKVRRKVDNV